MTSWGYRNVPPVDNDELIDWGVRAATAMELVNGRKYNVGSAGKTLYLAGMV